MPDQDKSEELKVESSKAFVGFRTSTQPTSTFSLKSLQLRTDKPVYRAGTGRQVCPCHPPAISFYILIFTSTSAYLPST